MNKQATVLDYLRAIRHKSNKFEDIGHDTLSYINKHKGNDEAIGEYHRRRLSSSLPTYSGRLEAHKDNSAFNKDPKSWMQKAEKEFGKKAEDAFIRGFIKAAGMSPQMAPIGANNPPQSTPQPGSNSAGVPPPPPGQPQMPGGVAPMQTPAPQGSPGMQQFMQLMQQLKQQHMQNPQDPASKAQHMDPVLNQHLLK